LISDKFISKRFKEFELRFKESSKYGVINPIYAQLAFGKTDKNWDNQKYKQGCKACKLLFREKNIISDYCFSCFKIEIHLDSVVDLFKLMFLFNDYNFKNNFRKLWINPKKSEINYAGSIYFRSLEEANSFLDHFKKEISLVIKPNKIILKRGCREFNQLLPNFFDINENYNSLVADKSKWGDIERNFANSDVIKNLPVTNFDYWPDINNFTLPHFIIMCTWLAFAKFIGDESYKKITKTDLGKLIKI